MRLISLWTTTIVLALSGCGGDDAKKASTPPSTKSNAKAPEPAHHDHASVGPHEGALAEWGQEEFHPEFTVDHNAKSATVYVLDGSAKKSKPIASKEIVLTLKVKPAVTLSLKPKPMEGDPPGTSSRFVGEHAFLATVMEFSGTLSAEIDGKPFSGDFKEEAHDEKSHVGKGHGAKDAKNASGMDSIAKEAVGGTPFEKELYLKPGGIYTEADIKANGNTVPSVKFAGKHWEHADDVKPGDYLCPITNNKAESACSWVVNGKNYQFCCNPCIDKFVKWAKNTPEKIKEPDAYRVK